MLSVGIIQWRYKEDDDDKENNNIEDNDIEDEKLVRIQTAAVLGFKEHI